MATNHNGFNERLTDGEKRALPEVRALLRSFGIKVGRAYTQDDPGATKLIERYHARLAHDLRANGWKIEIKSTDRHTYQTMLEFPRVLVMKQATARLETERTLATIFIPCDAYTEGGLLDMRKLLVISHKESREHWIPQRDNAQNDPCDNYYAPKQKESGQYVWGGNGVYWGVDAIAKLIDALISHPRSTQVPASERFRVRKEDERTCQGFTAGEARMLKERRGSKNLLWQGSFSLNEKGEIVEDTEIPPRY